MITTDKGFEDMTIRECIAECREALNTLKHRPMYCPPECELGPKMHCSHDWCVAGLANDEDEEEDD